MTLIQLRKKLIVAAFVLVILFTLFTESNANDDQYRIVKTINGEIRGKRNITLFDKKPYYTFRGIPFAQPPLGELRFKPPVPINSWTGVKDAFEYGMECIQLNMLTAKPFGTEDCLFLNIFVPENLSNEKLAVMFFIHGGGYISGSANGYGPDFLINKDVILVTVNYRLNIFGFMSLGNAEYSGNMGLKDQWLALKWVNDNIEFFGGDKSRITIFGESAGAGSVGFHSISPKSRGLFQRVILQSGSELNPWAFNYEDNHLKEMKELALKHGNLQDGYYDDFIKYVKNADAEQLLNAFSGEIYIVGASRKLAHISCAPVKEVSSATDPFLTEFPEDILKKPSATDIDTMFGITSAEMISLMLGEILEPSLLKEFDQVFELQLPKKHLKYDYNSKEYIKMAKDIRKFYFPKNVQVGANSLNEFISLQSDIWFNYGIIDAARLQHRHSTGKTYLYQFSLKTELSALKTIFGTSVNVDGTPHGDDLLYVFRYHSTLFGEPFVDAQGKLPLDSLEVKSIRMVADLWTNFAKYGTPTLPTDSVNFKPIENDVMNYVDITNDGLIPKVGLLQKNVKFWDSLYRKYKDVFQNTILLKDEL